MADDDDAAKLEMTGSLGTLDAAVDAGDSETQLPSDRDTAGDGLGEEDRSDEDERRTRRWSSMRLAFVTGTLAFVVLVALAGWIGFRADQSHRAAVERNEIVEVAKQGAVNLTTIDFEHVEGDVQRILDSATGTFHDDFNTRAKPFIDVVKSARSKSVGTVVDAGLESQSDGEAQVLVAVNVKTTVGDGTPQDPRSWRMRISVDRVGSQDLKISDVSFVP